MYYANHKTEKALARCHPFFKPKNKQFTLLKRRILLYTCLLSACFCLENRAYCTIKRINSHANLNACDFRLDEYDLPNLKSGFRLDESDLPFVKFGFRLDECDFPNLKSGFRLDESDLPNLKSGFRLDECDFPNLKSGFRLDECDLPFVKFGFRLDEIHLRLNEIHLRLDEIHLRLDEIHLRLNEIHLRLNENNSILSDGIHRRIKYCSLVEPIKETFPINNFLFQNLINRNNYKMLNSSTTDSFTKLLNLNK